MKFFLATLTALLALTGGSAFATVVTYQHTTTTATAPFADSFTLPAFDASLGTLTSIEIGLSFSAQAEVDVYNAKTSNQSFTNATASVPVTIDGPAAVSVSKDLVAGPVASTAAVGFNSYSGLTATGSSSMFVSAADFLDYTAAGPGVSLSFVADVGDGTYSGTAAPGVFFSGSADVGGITSITYTYTPTPLSHDSPVPEPATLALLATGIFGMGFVRRRSH